MVRDSRQIGCRKGQLCLGEFMELASKISRKIRDILGTFLYTILEKIRDRPRQKKSNVSYKKY